MIAVLYQYVRNDPIDLHINLQLLQLHIILVILIYVTNLAAECTYAYFLQY